MRRKAIIFFLLVLLLAFREAGKADVGVDKAIPCDIHREACTKTFSGGTGGTVTLDISPKPVPMMKDLIFQVRLDGVKLKDDPFIDLSMPGMKMGLNRVKLKLSPDGTFSGNGVIVRCPSGKTLWMATIIVPDIGTADFTFNAVP